VLSFAIWKKVADLITFWVAHPEMIPTLFNASTPTLGLPNPICANDIISNSWKCSKKPVVLGIPIFAK
jgi:hypothetical protein